MSGTGQWRQDAATGMTCQDGVTGEPESLTCCPPCTTCFSMMIVIDWATSCSGTAWAYVGCGQCMGNNEGACPSGTVIIGADPDTFQDCNGDDTSGESGGTGTCSGTLNFFTFFSVSYTLTPGAWTTIYTDSHQEVSVFWATQDVECSCSDTPTPPIVTIPDLEIGNTTLSFACDPVTNALSVTHSP